MSIAKTDIKLMASERLTDYYDGGGQMTGTEIVDGVVNNLFPDISRLDRVYGRVSLRKEFPAVMSENTDMYYGCHVIITQPPEDDNVHVTAFTTGDFYDERDDAKNRIESYVSIAHELLWRPMNDQLVGQRAITAFARPGTQRPEIGETIVLKNTVTLAYQYLRITSIESEEATFAHSSYGSFTVEILTLGLSAALQYTFPGIEATPYTTKASSRIHATVVADASSYYGVKKMAQAASSGAMTFWVDSIYNQLVPTSQVETALVDQLMGGDNVAMIAKGATGGLTFSASRSNTTNIIHLPEGVLPGSLAINIIGYAFRDVRGNLVAVDTDGGFSGYLDYASGQITIERATAWGGIVSLTATAACAVSQAFTSREIAVELANRAYNYTPNLNNPLPSPGSITVSYMAQGKWYELRDDGAGVFVGAEQGIGTGTVDYASGSAIITLGALPDVGTSIIIQWGHGTEITDRRGTISAEPMMIRNSLPHDGIKPASLTIAWLDGATPKTATDDGNGAITGDAVGTISYGAGEILFRPNSIPESGTEYSIIYEQQTPTTSTIMSVTATDNTLTFVVPNAPLRPGSVSVSYSVQQIRTVSADGTIQKIAVAKAAHDDGLGNMKNGAGTTIGTISYASGEINILGLDDYTYTIYGTPSIERDNYGVRYTLPKTTGNAVQEAPTTINANYAQDVAATWLPQTDSLAAPELVLDLAPTTVETLVPNSVVFTMAGSTWYDDGNGNLYRDRSTSTGVGTFAGTINYATGLATITTYPALASTAATLTSLLTRDGGMPQTAFVFRTPGAPVRDGSLSLRATTAAGTLYTAQAGNDGSISDTGVSGTIDTTVGVVRVSFGAMVTAAGNEDEPWYDADLVEGGMIWQPYAIMPETALYNCVIYTYLPLDASLLGIEPIRLPLDGRVPIFKSGNVAVVHHTADELLPSPLSSGQTVTLSRGALALCELRDQDGDLVDEALYTVDLAAGTVTMADPLDLTGYTQPLVAAHRIEDMVLISEAQINGLIRTVGPLTHSYPANTTQVSSALIFGDLAARVVRSYTQKTWDNVWRDARSGDDTTAKYNDLLYPVQLTNKGSIAQRWAIVFTSSTAFNVVSENMGVIATGNTSSDVAIINPFTGAYYFRLDYRGWGTGWASGNVLRFDTSAANAPMWLARTTMQGAVEEPTDEFVIQIRGDAN
ncbi:MAG: hypothetical protein AB7E55_00925 [Pigmentiphaga sp.]